jgi:hypothetical protein
MNPMHQIVCSKSMSKQRVRVRHLASIDLAHLRHHFSLSDCSFITHTSLYRQPGKSRSHRYQQQVIPRRLSAGLHSLLVQHQSHYHAYRIRDTSTDSAFSIARHQLQLPIDQSWGSQMLIMRSQWSCVFIDISTTRP